MCDPPPPPPSLPGQDLPQRDSCAPAPHAARSFRALTRQPGAARVVWVCGCVGDRTGWHEGWGRRGGSAGAAGGGGQADFFRVGERSGVCIPRPRRAARGAARCVCLAAPHTIEEGADWRSVRRGCCLWCCGVIRRGCGAPPPPRCTLRFSPTLRPPSSSSGPTLSPAPPARRLSLSRARAMLRC